MHSYYELKKGSQPRVKWINHKKVRSRFWTYWTLLHQVKKYFFIEITSGAAHIKGKLHYLTFFFFSKCISREEINWQTQTHFWKSMKDLILIIHEYSWINYIGWGELSTSNCLSIRQITPSRRIVEYSH